MIRANNLSSAEMLGAGIRHCFFTRRGGHSTGLYDSLNCGLGSGDNPELVMRNRSTAMAALGFSPDHLNILYQVHSSNVVVVTADNAPELRNNPPNADAMVTRQPGIVLGILTADCAPVLLADPEAGVIGAAHAGWRGAAAGIVQNTVAEMISLGATPGNIAVSIGPCIAQQSYEVGPDFRAEFSPQDARFFAAATKKSHYQFNLSGYVKEQVERAGVTRISLIPQDTYQAEEMFFSYRRNTHRGEQDYGRGLSAIAISGKRIT